MSLSMEDEDVAKPADDTPLPLFKVKVPEAIKKGETVLFTVITSRVGEEKEATVQRQHEDLEWLHHNLITANATEGVIVPPLPVKRVFDPKTAEKQSKNNLGGNTKVLKGDDFESDCKSFQKYIEMMMSHSKFGRDSTLEKFLMEEEAAVRARLNKGMFSRLGSAINTARNANHKDIDEYFTSQRNFANEYSKAVKEASINYNKLVVAQWRLSSSYRQLATDLTTCTAEKRDDQIIKLNKILKLISEGSEDEAGSLELRSGQGELSLGFYLDLFARYSDSLKDMHLRRTTSLIEFEASEKAAEKAKPAKKVFADEAMERAKKVLETSSEQARRELKMFTQQKLLASEEALSAYAELQMKISQDFYSQLFHTKKSLIELKL